MASPSERWIDGLQYSSLFGPPPQDLLQRKAQTTSYIEYFVQFTSEQFPDDITECEYSEQWALACGEILRILTLYNCPMYKNQNLSHELERRNSSNGASASKVVSDPIG
ncbi:hypothetical protein SAY86_021852 [Trapa natans]|uniref:Uncharacterized protein n=1 Tax=Trapa natans TaxID=22666 RepID=A0AAN7RFX2_TRANT|nr:hypothetical protein SAY86_021852 [Trapa natans]